METRIHKGIEIVQRADAKGISTIKGYGLKWSETINYGNMFRERFEKGAFAETLASNDVKLMVGHNYESLPLARISNGTMRVHENEWGLVVEADLEDADPEAQSLASKIRSGLADGMSVGFTMDGGEETIESGKKKKDGTRELDLHVIKKVGELREVSVVTWPAYSSSAVGMKRTADLVARVREEKELAMRKLRVKSVLYSRLSKV